jgi:hypothetical protein
MVSTRCQVPTPFFLTGNLFGLCYAAADLIDLEKCRGPPLIFEPDPRILISAGGRCESTSSNRSGLIPHTVQGRPTADVA